MPTMPDVEQLNSMSTAAHGSRSVTLAIIGCGQRGEAYATYALQEPDKCKVVAIAEPRPQARAAFTKTHSLTKEAVFNSWQELHRRSADVLKETGTKLAEAVLVTVQDRLHCEVVCAFAEHGYDILCEKPMATSVGDCVKMAMAVKKGGVIFGVGHVLRYSPYNKAVAAIIDEGSLGKLVNIHHLEPVGHWHFAHSYVRGAWAKESESSFSLMTKSCHDIDIICSMMAPAKPVRVSSFGSLQHFKKSEKPPSAGSATRCLDCAIESECPYSAKSIYLDRIKAGHTDWPVAPLVDGIPDIENVGAALRQGPYGVCVYESDNDVVDHQVVSLEFSTGTTANFTMAAFSDLICERQTRLHFTHGEVVGDSETVRITDFRKRKALTRKKLEACNSVEHAGSILSAKDEGVTVLSPEAEGGGHGGGDFGLIRAFTEAVRTRNQSKLGIDIDDILRSHLTVFAAETSRREGRVIDIALFEAGIANDRS